jgi:glycosyltransferase involved in cell wall biosynthesis
VNLRIFHSEEACAAAATRFGPGGETLVMPHGNYDGVFPSPRPPAETRAELGVPPGTNLLLMAGNLRAYKGIAAAAEASATTGVPIRLLAAGRAEGSDRRSLESLARSYAHLQVEFGRLSEQRVADLHGAADAVLLPYSQVSGSGALLTALTCARGVITSDRPYFREVLNPEPQAGTIARDGSIASLAVAIEEFLAGDAVQRASAARRLADRYSWDRVVPPVAKWLLSLTPNP